MQKQQVNLNEIYTPRTHRYVHTKHNGYKERIMKKNHEFSHPLIEKFIEMLVLAMQYPFLGYASLVSNEHSDKLNAPVI